MSYLVGNGHHHVSVNCYACVSGRIIRGHCFLVTMGVNLNTGTVRVSSRYGHC